MDQTVAMKCSTEGAEPWRAAARDGEELGKRRSCNGELVLSRLRKNRGRAEFEEEKTEQLKNGAKGVKTGASSSTANTNRTAAGGKTKERH